MPTTQPLVAAVLALTLAGTAATAVASAPAPGHHAFRVAGVVTTTTDGLHVSAVQLSVTPSPAGPLRARVRVTVTNTSAADVRRVLQIAPCADRCHGVVRRVVAIPGRRTTTYVLHGSMPAGAREITAALNKPHAPSPLANTAAVELSPRGWNGATAGRSYGMTLSRHDALRIAHAAWFLSAGTSRVATIRLSFVGPDPTAVHTVLRRCVATCAGATVAPAPTRDGPTRFDVYRRIARRGADSAQVTVTAPGGGTLLAAALPWP